MEAVPRTAMDVFRVLPEGTRCELIENVSYMLPERTHRHERIRIELYFRTPLQKA
jgi:hypothetical protein